VNIVDGSHPYNLSYQDDNSQVFTEPNYDGGAITVAPTETTVYSNIVITDSNGCSATLVENGECPASGTSITVTVTALPDVTLDVFRWGQ